MKKIIMAMLALALVGSAFADTKTENVYLGGATSIYVPKADGTGQLGGSTIVLGNYYLGSTYVTDNIFEFDISALEFASIDSVRITNFEGFFGLKYAADLDENVGAIKISFYEGGTGTAEADWKGSDLTLVKEISGLSTKELSDGFTIKDLGFGDDDILTFVISIDQSLIPEMSTEGIGVRSDTSRFQLTLTGTSAIPEPSTYAAIFGALALGFVIYRRRK